MRVSAAATPGMAILPRALARIKKRQVRTEAGPSASLRRIVVPTEALVLICCSHHGGSAGARLVDDPRNCAAGSACQVRVARYAWMRLAAAIGAAVAVWQERSTPLPYASNYDLPPGVRSH